MNHAQAIATQLVSDPAWRERSMAQTQRAAKAIARKMGVSESTLHGVVLDALSLMLTAQSGRLPDGQPV